jgi:hypothetical protein
MTSSSDVVIPGLLAHAGAATEGSDPVGSKLLFARNFDCFVARPRTA